jgi:hypothetical protein
MNCREQSENNKIAWDGVMHKEKEQRSKRGKTQQTLIEFGEDGEQLLKI